MLLTLGRLAAATAATAVMGMIWAVSPAVRAIEVTSSVTACNMHSKSRATVLPAPLQLQIIQILFPFSWRHLEARLRDRGWRFRIGF